MRVSVSALHIAEIGLGAVLAFISILVSLNPPPAERRMYWIAATLAVFIAFFLVAALRASYDRSERLAAQLSILPKLPHGTLSTTKPSLR